MPHRAKSFIYRIYAKSRAKSFIYRTYAAQPGVGGPKPNFFRPALGAKTPVATAAALNFQLSTVNLRCGESFAPRIQLNSQQLLQGGMT